MKEEKRVVVMFVTIFFMAMSLPLLIYRLVLVDNVVSHFRWYASAYICDAMEEESTLRVEDVDIIVERLTPQKLSSALNLSKWSESQFTKDKELLSMCKEVWEKREAEEEQRKKDAEKSFNERLETWKKKK